MYLRKCLDLVNQRFYDNWIEIIDIDKEANFPVPFFEFYTGLNDFSNDFFKLLNLSVISGEYVGLNEFAIELDALENALNRVAESVSSGGVNDDKYNQLNNIIVNELIQPILKALSHYRQLYVNIYESLKKPDSFILFKASKTSNETKSQTAYIETIKSTDLFVRYNIGLAYYDHEISVDKDKLSELLLIHLNLENSKSETDSIKTILFYKCNYLISKILARIKKDKESLSYLAGNEVKEIQSKAYLTGPYKLFLDKMLLHYSEETEYEHDGAFEEKIQGLMDIYDDKRLTTYESFHSFVKYYKDNNVDENKLMNSYLNLYKINQQLN